MRSSVPSKACLPPVGAGQPSLLVLGSLPGERSLSEGRYYAHPQNQFWRLLGPAIAVDLAALDYDARLAALVERGVALWDVVGSARRIGSLDTALRDVAPNPLFEFARTHTELRCIGFNGKAAARIGRRALAGIDDIVLIDLPSSSPAYTLPIAEKARDWDRLGDFASAVRIRHHAPRAIAGEQG